MDLDAEIASIDEARLLPIVARALERNVSAVEGLTSAPITYRVSNPVSAALIRYSGSATSGPGVRPWSLVLKVIREAGDVAGDALYRWDREALVYATNVVPEADGFRAARCYAVETLERAAFLWLEDVVEDRPVWDIARYALAARQIGRMNAASVGRVPQHEWLTRNAIATWAEAFNARLGSEGVFEDDAIWDEDVVRAEFPASARTRLRALWREREHLRSTMAAAPLSFAHLDAFRANLLSSATATGSETVAVDWSFAGIAPLGAEVSQLVCGSLFYQREQLPASELDGATFDAYVAGLRDAGWRGDERIVRRSAVASALLRWGFLMPALKMATDAAMRERVEERSGRPYAEHIAETARKAAYMLSLADELDRLTA